MPTVAVESPSDEPNGTTLTDSYMVVTLQS